ncbi:endolytic transglycosylase MltG [Candidatus Saccharibacteria bacterium]|nr:endolytic transglycosylase MltG [Candidatus Saccharibacteria bacterium]
MKVLGLDVGEKRIGVAQADSATRIAVPVGYIIADGTEWEEIRRFSTRFNTKLFVVGLPRSNDGNETAQSQYVRNFVARLAKELPGAQVKFQDESLTSVVAEERLRSRRKAYEKGEIDAEAASIILQDFLDGCTTKIPEDYGKKKSKLGLKIFSGVMILVILGLLATGAVLFIKDKRAKERAEEYARKEAEMVAATFKFTIKPGETIMDIKKNLLAVDRNGASTAEEKLPNYTSEEVEEAFSANYDFEMLKSRPEGASLEGYLYPETIEFYGNSTVEEVLGRFLGEMQKAISENGLEAKYAERGLTLHQGIILASVVQKEANPADQATVAQVFLSRIAYGMALGSDVTVTYALDLADPGRTTYNNNYDALRIDSCYNTRLYAGIPCGAISNPGLTALQAVAEPTETDYLYFLTGDDGLMYYSHTEAEHNQNIYTHCQELCNVLL